MLELKNINKTYKSKKKQSVEALKDISIKFDKTGMVFILGKSGSGKSTLLNIIGGLDKQDNGDLFINGVSSNFFKNSDYDAYRNTYIGFIFQDFNLLEKYSIEKNISISLELQNKKINKEEIDHILKIVGLEDIKKRKPNQLSGGQKQRVAIARALIKNTEVILADEPTGNLDSVTSRQIFDLLKKISKDKLVIVVSHDEESAKKYADRIINIKDGEIIEDTKPINDITEEAEKFKLIKAKLPFKYSLKMGLENFFHKKIKLFFTILLISFSIICLGLTKSATSFNIEEQLISKYKESKDNYIYIQDYKDAVNFKETFLGMFNTDISTYEYLFPNPLNMTDEKIQEIESKTKMKWVKQTKLNQNSSIVSINFNNENAYGSMYYVPLVSPYFIDINEDDSINSSNVIGTLPINDDEIVVSKFIADNIIENGINIENNGKTENYKPKNYSQIIKDNPYIKITNLKSLKIVGILDTDMKDVELLKNIIEDDYMYSFDYDDVVNIYYSNLDLYSRVYTTSNFINSLNLKENNSIHTITKILYNKEIDLIDSNVYINDKLDIYDGSTMKTVTLLNDNEVIIDINVLNKITNGKYYTELEKYLNNNWMDYDYSIDTFTKKFINDNKIIGSNVKTGVTKDVITRNPDMFNEYKIVGVNLKETALATIYYSKNILDKLVPEEKMVNSVYYYLSNEEDLKNVINKYPIDNSNTISKTNYSDAILESSLFTYFIEIIGQYGSIFFLIFAIILLINFITNSVSFRKKEIGILRAIGCKSKDILKMFFVECGMISIICLIISYFAISSISDVFNKALSNFMAKDINFLSFGISEFGYLVLIVFGIMLIANIIPIRKLTKMKPIDVINNK